MDFKQTNCLVSLLMILRKSEESGRPYNFSFFDLVWVPVQKQSLKEVNRRVRSSTFDLFNILDPAIKTQRTDSRI